MCVCVCVCAGPGNPQYLPLGLEHHVTFAGKVFLIVDIFGSEEYSFSKTTTAVEHQKDRGPSNNISEIAFARFKNGSHMIGLKVEQPTASSNSLP